jgi:hypothetical protein
MRRTWAAAVVCGAVAAAGCPDSGPPKREIAQPVDGGRGETPPVKPASTAKPAKTDPAAEAVIEKLLNAYTGGKPQLLESVKVHKLTRRGAFTAGGSTEPSVWTTQAVWPDRFRTEAEFIQFGNKKNIKAKLGTQFWELKQLEAMTDPKAMSVTDRELFNKDATAEWWCLLVPLLDRTALVAAPADPVVIDAKPTTGVRVWRGEDSPVVLRIDDATGLLARIDYNNAIPSGLVPIEIRLTEYKPMGGVQLPTKSRYVVNSKMISTWDSAEYEFPKQIPDEVFVKP